MLFRIDWKFVIPLILAVAGLVVPVWLFQVDLSSKALSLTVKTTAQIHPKSVSAVDGVQVLVDGRELSEPFVSVLELTNSGTRPIAASDFEGPLRISALSPSLIVRARQDSVVPSSLAPVTSIRDGEIVLQPLLLNPGDVIRFNVITSNAKPDYSVRVRIAGVQEVSLTDFSIRESRRYWLNSGLIVFLLVVYFVSPLDAFDAYIRNRSIKLWPVFVAFVAATAASVLFGLNGSLDAVAFESIVPLVLAAGLVALPIFIYRVSKLLTFRRMKA